MPSNSALQKQSFKGHKKSLSAVKSKTKINSVNNRLYKTPARVPGKVGMSRKSSIEGLFLPKIYGNEGSPAKGLGLNNKNKKALYNSIDYAGPP